MDDLHVGDWTIPAAELEERFDTSGGPGGQHANRNETSVRLRLDVETCSLPLEVKSKLISRIGPIIEVTASDQRSQSRNRETARDRLQNKIESVLVDPKPRRKTKPTNASKNRRVDAKKARSEVKRQRQRPATDD